MNSTSSNMPPKLRSRVACRPEHGVRQTAVVAARAGGVRVHRCTFWCSTGATSKSTRFSTAARASSTRNSPFKVFAIALVMAVLPSLWLPYELRHPSQVCYWLIYLCVVVPTMFLPYHVLTYQSIGESSAAAGFDLALFRRSWGFRIDFRPFRVSKAAREPAARRGPAHARGASPDRNGDLHLGLSIQYLARGRL